MTSEERDKLIARLERQSDKIKQEFGYLYACTRQCLDNLNVTADMLQDFFEGCGVEELADEIKSTDSVSDVMRKANRGGFWTFFNYNLLESIINNFCVNESALVTTLNDYISKFSVYCERRIYEVPIDVIKGAAELSMKPESAICLKLDDRFKFSDPLNKTKYLQILIEELLNVKPSYLINVKEGCIEIIFRYFKKFKEVFPLQEKQISELAQIGVKRLWCDSYEVFMHDEQSKQLGLFP